MTQAETAVAIDRLRELAEEWRLASYWTTGGTPSSDRLEIDREKRVIAADLRSLITAYESQAERLREVEGALEPFADKAALIDDVHEDDYCPMWSPFIPVSAYRRARSALQSRPATENGK